MHTLFDKFHQNFRFRCTGVEIAGLALAAAGTTAGVVGAQQSKNAMERKTKQELLRQNSYQKEAQRSFATSLGESTPAKASTQVDEGAAAARAEYDKLQKVPIATEGLSAAPTENTTVNEARNTGFGNLIAKPNSELQGFNNYAIQQWIKDMATNQQLGLTSSFARKSQGVLPFELEHASHKGDTIAGIGQILSALGGVTGMYGAMTAPAVAGAAGGTAGAAGFGSAAMRAPLYRMPTALY